MESLIYNIDRWCVQVCYIEALDQIVLASSEPINSVDDGLRNDMKGSPLCSHFDTTLASSLVNDSDRVVPFSRRSITANLSGLNVYTLQSYFNSFDTKLRLQVPIPVLPWVKDVRYRHQASI